MSEMDCKFCQFASDGPREHVNGLPFLVLRETALTLAFLSAYQSATTTGHIIVIPKKHSEYLEELDAATRHALIDEAILVSGLVRSVHPASNILVNNGPEAGQHEPHVHFHVIPREMNDHVVVDSEPGSVMSGEDYTALHAQYARLAEDIELYSGQ